MTILLLLWNSPYLKRPSLYWNGLLNIRCAMSWIRDSMELNWIEHGEESKALMFIYCKLLKKLLNKQSIVVWDAMKLMWCSCTELSDSIYLCLWTNVSDLSEVQIMWEMNVWSYHNYWILWKSDVSITVYCPVICDHQWSQWTVWFTITKS